MSDNLRIDNLKLQKNFSNVDFSKLPAINPLRGRNNNESTQKIGEVDDDDEQFVIKSI
jgi:hypothetical protein